MEVLDNFIYDCHFKTSERKIGEEIDDDGADSHHPSGWSE